MLSTHSRGSPFDSRSNAHLFFLQSSYSSVEMSWTYDEYSKWKNKKRQKEGGADSLYAENKDAVIKNRGLSSVQKLGHCQSLTEWSTLRTADQANRITTLTWKFIMSLSFASRFNKMEDGGTGIKTPSREMVKFFESRNFHFIMLVQLNWWTMRFFSPFVVTFIITFLATRRKTEA